MSVIQEALRRKMAEQAERGGSQPPPTQPSSATNYQIANPSNQQSAPTERQPTRHAVPPPQAEPQQSRGTRAPAERSASWFVLLFLFLLAGGAAALFFVQSRQQGGTAGAAFTAGPAERSDVPVYQEIGETEDEVVIVEEMPSEPNPEPAEVAAVARPEPEEPVAESEPSRAVAAKQDTVTRDDWPKIELMGILAGGGEELSTAILNGALVMLNAEIDGVTLADVGEDGVYLEFKGDRQYIRIGEYTR